MNLVFLYKELLFNDIQYIKYFLHIGWLDYDGAGVYILTRKQALTPIGYEGNINTAVIFAQMLGKGHAINTGRLNIQHGRIYVQQPPHGIGVLLYGRLFLYVYFMAGLFFPRFNLPYEPLHILWIIFQNQKVQLVFSPSKNVKSCWNFNSW